MKRRWVALFVFVTVAISLHASYLVGHEDGLSARRDDEDTQKRDNPLVRVLGDLTVLDGYTYRGLTVFLLRARAPEDPTAYLSTSEAIAARHLQIKEDAAHVVSRLLIRNRGRRPILLLAGEVLEGGKQDRVLRDDVLLSGHSSWTEVPVACVEENRWSEEREFVGETTVAPQTLRAQVQTGQPQDALWQKVRQYHNSLKVESPTRALSAIGKSEALQEQLGDYRRHFSTHCWRPRTVGMVVSLYGRIVGADVFCNETVFRKHRDRLLASYVIDCVVRRDAGKAPEEDSEPATTADAERFLRESMRAEVRREKGHGNGVTLRVIGDRIRGGGLLRGKRLLHVTLCPLRPVLIRPPQPVPLPGPRSE